ncbi:hypothetical protein V1509DRAFT_675942 [Lipomyces kononenkoae]
MEDNHVRYDIEDEDHVTDTIVDLYSPDFSCEVTPEENENEGILHEGRTAFSVAQHSASSSSLSVSPSPLSTMPLENIDFEAPATIVAQERNNIQALKRISLDASSTSDPDLPAASIALLQQGPTSPPSTSPPSASPNGSPQAFPGEDLASSQPDGPLLWVPAHLHPELAPKEWRTFVQERVAEIQQRTGATTFSLSETASQSLGSGTLSVPGSAGPAGTGIVRRKSKLSREIDISDDGYEDGADVLQERAKAKSPEGRVSALEWLEAYGRKTHSANGTPDLPGGVVISDGNVIAPLQNGRGLRRSQHTSRKNKRQVDSEERLPVTSEEPPSEDEGDEKSMGRKSSIERHPSRVLSTTHVVEVPDRGPQVTVTDGKLQLNINETDLGSLDIDADVVIKAAKFVDIPDVPVAPDSLHQSPPSVGALPGHASSCSTSSSSTVSSVSSTSTAKALSPDLTSSPQGASVEANVVDKYRNTSRSATPTQKLSSTYRQLARLTSKRAIVDMLSRSSSSPDLSADSVQSPGIPTNPITPLTTTRLSADIRPTASADSSLTSVIDPSTSAPQVQSQQPGPSLKKRGKALTAGFGRLFAASDKDKAKDKDRGLGRKNNSASTVRVSSPSRVERLSVEKDVRPREALEAERPITPITEMEKGPIMSSKESKVSGFFAAKKKSLTKSSAAPLSTGGQRDKKKNTDRTKHVRTSRSSSSLSSTYTDRQVGKSQSQSSSPSPSHAQITAGGYGRPYYYSRFPLHVERAIYRLSHLKLANPRRPLCQQVLLSNFMYGYLELINQDSMYGYQQQQYAYQQQQYMYQQQLQLQQQAYMQNLQLQMYQQQSQNIWNKSQQQPLQPSYPDEENMFAGLESPPASDRPVNRSVKTPAVARKSDDVDTYWQDSDSDDDVYGTYFDDTEDEYPVGPGYEDGHFEEAVAFGDGGSFKPSSNPKHGPQFYIPAETYYETISRQQKEQADRAQYQQQAASNKSAAKHPQTVSTSGGSPTYQSSSSHHQRHRYNGYANYYYGAERQAQVVGGYYRD